MIKRDDVVRRDMRHVKFGQLRTQQCHGGSEGLSQALLTDQNLATASQSKQAGRQADTPIDYIYLLLSSHPPIFSSLSKCSGFNCAAEDFI
jgi:hypothetical protein